MATSAGIAVLACFLAGMVNGQTLGTYTFAGADPAGELAVPTATNLNFTPFDRVNVSPVSVSDLFRSDGWTTANAQDAGEFVAFVITPAPAYRLSLTSLSFEVRRSVNKASPSEKDGPLSGQVQILQGLSLTPVDSQDFSPLGVWQNVVVSFTDFTTLDGESVTIRLYGWNSGHNNGWLDFDNVTLEGSVLQTPEPSPAVLISCGILLFFLRCRLHRR